MTEDRSVVRHGRHATVARYDWGEIRILLEGDVSPRASFGSVVTHPGNRGHALHNHTAEDEIIYIVSGEGAYMTDAGPSRTVRAGDCIYVPAGVPHATVNTGAEDLRLIIVYTPPGPEKELDQISGLQGMSGG